MNLTVWVDVAIGLMVVYLGASLFVTVINEYVAQVLNLRGRQLCTAMKTLISEERVRDILKQSPAIKPFFGPQKGAAPSYVDPNVLGRLLVGGLAAGAAAGGTVKQASETIAKLPDSGLKTQLLALVQTAGTTTEALVEAVSDWADRSLTMLGEGYKRHLQRISFGVGLAVAVGLNVDTVALIEHLYRDKDARDAAVALGVQIAEKTGKDTFERCMGLTLEERGKDAACSALTGLVDAVQGRNETLGKLPLGWGAFKTARQRPPKAGTGDVPFWTARVAGWLLTALALSLGAPFWFDLLNKLVNMRHGMRRPEVKEEEAKKPA